MLHRSVTLVHGGADAWSNPEESALLATALASAGEAAATRLVAGLDHDLSGASDDLIAELADDLAARLLPRDLPPLLVAIEKMG
jgi:alpha-beta hydrolase superfamily lysophospholipase